MTPLPPEPPMSEPARRKAAENLLSDCHSQKGEGQTIPVPIDALRWLFGMGDTFSSEGKRGAFWWRSEFMERSGISHEQLVEKPEERTP